MIATVRRDNPAAYLRFAAAFAPKDVPALDPLGGITDLELTDMIEHLRARIADDAAPLPSPHRHHPESSPG